MKYLLVGNGPLLNENYEFRQYDAIIQINACIHADLLPQNLTKYVFIVNSDPEISPTVINSFLEKSHLMPQAQIVLTRNQIYLAVKRNILGKLRSDLWKHYKNSKAWCCLLPQYKIHMLSFVKVLSIDIELFIKGMRFDQQPSSGLVAYKWIESRMKRGDKLDVIGFTFQGWHGHAWDIEKKIIKNK